MRRELFLPTSEGEARILLLIDSFTGRSKSLEGRTKLAKLDFFLRYPHFLLRILSVRANSHEISGVETEIALEEDETTNIETQMVRYRYGPWDPSYFALLGRLVGRGLVVPVQVRRGIGYRVTESGHTLASALASEEAWARTAIRARLMRRHLDLSGTTLKNLIYEHFPEVTDAKWGDQI